MRLTTAICLLLLVSTASPPAFAAEQCRPKAGALTELGLHYSFGRKLSSDSPRLTIQTASPGAPIRYTRVLVAPSAPESGWRLVIRDQEGRPLQVIDGTRFSATVPTLWSERLSTSLINLTLEFDRSLPDFSVRIPGYDAMPAEAENPYYSTKSAVPDWKDVYTSVPPDQRMPAESVGFLTSFDGASVTGVSTWCCSGSVIATQPDILFLTNFHCGGPGAWEDAAFCANTVIDMSWDGDSTSAEYACAKVMKKDERLDAVVLKIVPLTDRGYPLKPLKIRAAMPARGEPLHLFHHPQCLAKQMSSNCQVVGVEYPDWHDGRTKSDFTHRCDSEGGSSGAPVLDAAGTFVGLHHVGYQKDDFGVCDELNKAVSSAALLPFLAGFAVSVVP